MWFFTYKSGIHATIAGVLLATTIPHRIKEKDFSLLIKLEHAISPYVAFMIMPIFAFANAGVSLEGLSLSSLLEPVPLRYSFRVCLWVNKLELCLFQFIAVKFGVAQMPDKSNWLSLIWSFNINWCWFYNEFICWKLSFC